MTAKILVVDDNRETTEGLREVLSRAGYQVFTANTFPEGRSVLSVENPDLLIVDVRLGEFNGLQLVAFNEKPTPAIVVTGYADPVLEYEAQRLGAEYVMKPVLPSALLLLIKRKLAGLAPVQSRRWSRKPAELEASVAESPARIVNVSYGGMCVEIDHAHRPAEIPSAFDLTVPNARLSVHVNVVWKSLRANQRWLCGAELSEANPRRIGAWRGVVDAIA